jgi:hypothetical protein
MAFNLLTFSCLLFLASCASVKKEFVDPAFRAEGLKGSVVRLKCVSEINKPYGLTPHDERVILEDMRREILANHEGVKVVSEADGGFGSLKPNYTVEVNVTQDRTVSKNNRSKEFLTRDRIEVKCFYTTRTHLRHYVSATYRINEHSTGRRLWQASGQARHAKWYSIQLSLDLKPFLKPNLGPRLSEILRPVTQKVSAKIP